MRRLVLPTLMLALLFALLLSPADGEQKTLGKHPMADAKAGEWVLYSFERDRYKSYALERVLEVKGSKVYWELWGCNEEGKELKQLQYAGLDKVPSPWKPLDYQKVVKDEMVDLEIAGKTIKCRYFVVDQPENPPFPEPQVRREVWYSNDVPVRGKVKEKPQNREVVSWGTMSADDLEKAREMRKKREQARKKKDKKDGETK